MDNAFHHRGVLAVILANGAWNRRALIQRARAARGPRSAMRAAHIVDDILAAHTAPYAPRVRKLERLLAHSEAFANLSETAMQKLASLTVKLAPPRFTPIAQFANAGVP